MFWIVLIFLILLCLVIPGLQNAIPLQIKVGWWTLAMSFSSVVFWAAVGGGAIIALLSLPKLVRKTFQTRQLDKKVQSLEQSIKGICENRTQEEAT
jgi:uncharacterized integral membrane protein